MNQGFQAIKAQAGSLALVSPALLLLGILFFYPILLLFLTTLELENIGNYAQVVSSDTSMQVFFNTLRIAVIVTVVDLVLAYPLAVYISRLSPTAKTFAFFLVLIPLWTSQLVRTYAWMVLLGRNGPINNALVWLGIVDAPIRLANSEFAVIAGMTHILLPYMLLPIYNSVSKIDPSLFDAARGLGAGAFSTFTRVLMPLSIQGVLAGVSLVLVLSLGVFIMPALLGGGRVPVIALLIEQQAGSFLNWAMAGTLSAVLMVIVMITFFIIKLATRLFVRGRADAAFS
ncbi:MULTISPECIES: ABC transporter permease [Pseudomonadota]|jgi:putative spermidine/putrescine transport system permease protein|uniref:Binding-protein-dependent transport systems inner membrane component n=1 Tax=Chelativorans sp. (strain BNC1) TaxID=266779 RepID=Q11H69_CHESB|nr:MULTISPECIES: ABC transporter permease [Chelativorans]